MFALAPVEHEKFCLSLKVDPEEFDELIETPGIAQAPYAAKRMWFAMESLSALPKAEVERRIRASYDLVFAKLTKKAQAELSAPSKPKPPKTKKKR
jgi:predicted DNA-binding protein (MmcQ/YjbR family)